MRLKYRMIRPIVIVFIAVCLFENVVDFVNAQRLFIAKYYHTSASQSISFYNPSCYTVNSADYSISVLPYSASMGVPKFVPNTSKISLAPLRPISANSVVTWCTKALTPANYPNYLNMSCTYVGTTITLATNGTTTIALFHKHVLIDIIGNAIYPSQTDANTKVLDGSHAGINDNGYYNVIRPWTIANVTQATKTKVLVRNWNVTEGSPEFDYPTGRRRASQYGSQWTVYNTNNFPSFSVHSVNFQCSNSVILITCGTQGSDSIFQGLTQVQVVCPDHCLSTINNITAPFVIGTQPKYSRDSYICLSAIHAGILPLYSGNLVVVDQSRCFHDTLQVQSRDNIFIGIIFLSTGAPYTNSTPLCIPSFATPNTNTAYSLTAATQAMCEDNCSGNGHCNPKTGLCLCYRGFYGTTCDALTCPLCYNGGTCNSTAGQCQCPEPYFGSQCLQRRCILHDNCNSPIGGSCDTRTGMCLCNTGYTGPRCIAQTCPDNCSGNGRCSNGVCQCYSGYSGASCGIHHCFGEVSNFGTCDTTIGRYVCLPTNVFLSTGSSVSTTTLVESACLVGSCPNNCNNHGECNYYTRQCACESGYIGTDCSRAV